MTSGSYDVFLSFNSEDRKAVEKIAIYLEDKAKLRPWFDRWELIPGEPLIRNLERGLKASSSCAVFVGKNGEGPWQKREVDAALRQQMQNSDFRVIPVLLPDAPQKPELPAFLASNMWVEFQKKDLDDDDALWRLECGIRGVPPGKGKPLKPKQLLDSIEFVNRRDEIQKIKEIYRNMYYPRCLLISAPSGYGKSKLLANIKRQFQYQGGVCFYVEVSRSYTIKDIASSILQRPDSNGMRSPKEYGFEVAHHLITSVNATKPESILLIIDGIEALEKETVGQFLHEFMPAANEGLQSVKYNNKLRLILSGRYIEGWPRFYKNISQPITLSPFTFPVVQDTVKIFLTKKQIPFSEKQQQDFAAHLMYFTGGHPGCMIEILNDFRVGYPIQDFFVGKKEQHYKNVLKKVIDGIRYHITDQLRDIISTLSVVRRFDPLFLRWFIEKGLITWSKSEYELENLLLQTYLVNRENSFLKDDITRRLLAIHLRKTDLQYFIKVCEESISCYHVMLKDLKTYKSELVAIEILYQKLQLLVYKGYDDKDQFFESLAETLHALVSEQDSWAVMDSFIEYLSDDWEFRFTLNYLLRKEIYSDEYPFKELMERIEDFKQSLRGGN
jgi:hypothetical protein